MITYRYKTVSSRAFGNIKRPVADVFLQTASGKWMKMELFIDSGADITLIPYTAGLYLGLNKDESKIIELRGVAGQALPVIINTIAMKIGDTILKPRVGWALTDNVPPLLGRLDIFDKFNITFKEKEGIIIFEEVA